MKRHAINSRRGTVDSRRRYHRSLGAELAVAGLSLAHQLRSLVSFTVTIALISSMLMACNNTGPGAGVRWKGYPAQTQSTTTYRWLVLKCQLSDVAAIPAGLDTEIAQFLGISGTGYGNIVDYFHDVSYNGASVISDTFVGWTKAPFSRADLAGRGRLAPPGMRTQRVTECLNATPADQLPDLADFYGVIVVNNVVQDGGACAEGPIPILVRNKSHNLACVWFDPNSLFTAFAAHEIGHGLNLKHSYYDLQSDCGAPGAAPGEYCDPWDIMSALNTYQFVDNNWLVSGSPGTGGPGLNAPGLLRMGWIPAGTHRIFQYEGGEQDFKLRALSHPRGTEPLVLIMDVGATPGVSGTVTVEYRQSDGWDKAFTSSNVPVSVRSNGGAVLVHRFNSAGAPTSTLISGPSSGALTPCQKLVLTGNGGVSFHVSVKSFDLADGSANVSLGFGRGNFMFCPSDVISPGGVHFQRP